MKIRSAFLTVAALALVATGVVFTGQTAKADPIPACQFSADPSLTWPPYISFRCEAYDNGPVHLNAFDTRGL